jgi:hypothetical protein
MQLMIVWSNYGLRSQHQGIVEILVLRNLRYDYRSRQPSEQELHRVIVLFDLL